MLVGSVLVRCNVDDASLYSCHFEGLCYVYNVCVMSWARSHILTARLDTVLQVSGQFQQVIAGPLEAWVGTALTVFEWTGAELAIGICHCSWSKRNISTIFDSLPDTLRRWNGRDSAKTAARQAEAMLTKSEAGEMQSDPNSRRDFKMAMHREKRG